MGKILFRFLVVLAVFALVFGMDAPANTGAAAILARAQRITSPVKSLPSPAQTNKTAVKNPSQFKTIASGAVKDSAKSYSGAYINLSSYYLMPDQNFTVTGSNFAPNEQVEVLAAGISKTVTADNSGRFNTDSFKLSMGDVNSTVEVSARGKASGVLQAATLKVGTYYPQVTPSGYYVPAGSQVNFFGRQFAPNEEVVIRHGNARHVVTADTSGNFNFQTRLTEAGKAQTFVFTGAYTQRSVSVDITVGSTNY